MKTKTIRTDVWHYRIWKGADLFDFETPEQTDICKYRGRFAFNFLIMYPLAYLVGVPFCFTIYYGVFTPIAWLFGYKPRMIMFGKKIREPLFTHYKKFKIGKVKFYPFRVVGLMIVGAIAYIFMPLLRLVIQIQNPSMRIFAIFASVIEILFFMGGMLCLIIPVHKMIGKTKIYKSFTGTWKVCKENLKTKLKAKKEEVCHVVKFEIVEKR